MIGNIVTGIHAGFLPPVVTGGTLFTSGGFNYRVFTSSGTLGVSGGSISADILVIAGGGGGGLSANGTNGATGGGGAGGCLSFTSQTISSNQTVTIGAGGAGSGVAADVEAGKTVLGYPAVEARDALKQWAAIKRLIK